MVAFIILVSVFSAFAQIPVSATNRNIQRDGFLLEWNIAKAQAWGSWQWDAINTPEGLAGYFLLAEAAKCNQWQFILKVGGAGSVVVTVDTMPADSSRFYRIMYQQENNKQTIVVEWLIPRDLFNSSQPQQKIVWHGISACSDTLPVLELLVKQTGPDYKRRIWLQTVFIILLVVTLWAIKRRIQLLKRKRRT